MANGHIRINKSNLDRLRPSKKEQFFWDDKISGFGVRLSPKGRKSFIFQYRIGGAQRRISIGKFGPITPEQARSKAHKYTAQLADDHDPKALNADTTRKDILLKELCKLYLKNGCTHKKASTLYTDTGRIEHHIIPLLGNMPVTSIESYHIQQFMADIAEGKTATSYNNKRKFSKTVVKGGKGTASRTVGLLGGIFSYAQTLKLIDYNPCHNVKRFKDRVRNRHLTPYEWARLGKAMEEAVHLDQMIVKAIKLLMFTGCRVSEITSLKWDYVNLEHAQLYLPDSKTGAKIVPLGSQAVEMLVQVQKERSTAYVFNSKKADHIVNPRKTWLKLCKLAKIEDFRLHDLRHAFATAIVNSSGHGDRLLSVQKLLGHKDYKSSLRYAHLFDDRLNEEASIAAERIDRHLKGYEDTENGHLSQTAVS